MHRRKLNYGRSYLGRVEKQPVGEVAHRLVLWCTLGPPPGWRPDPAAPPAPGAIRWPVVMHVCNHASCINPLHLVWGELVENTRTPARQAYLHALQRWLAQWGPHFNYQ